ncbi:dynein light chain 2a [Babesia gibsoni]|uniref:Dynein light chain 2a n=1 Tax=Babesia gibsoni TaxID=33632 RepID=A0AAD8LL99_BABGI|nr:dynein light chain 2a [Babesia gibsoni]
MADWVPTIKQLALADNACFGCGIANAEDGELFSAADLDHEDLCWDSVYRDPYDFVGADEGGQPKTYQIVEKATIQEVFEKKCSSIGIFIGGNKYTFATYDDDCQVGSYTFECVSAAKNKGGAHLVKTPGGYLIICVFDENRGQNKTSSRMAAFALAEYMASNGY